MHHEISDRREARQDEGDRPREQADKQQEAALIRHLAGRLPPQRLFKLFVALRQRRVNNRRTRRLILSSILGSDRLAFWAVKYRHKLREALRPARRAERTIIALTMMNSTPTSITG